jgi:hypothetical protein
MRCGGFALLAGAVVLAASGGASADDKRVQTETHGQAATDTLTLADPGLRLEDAWPEPPRGHDLQLDQQLLDRMTDLGNRAASHLELASRESVGLRIDGRHQRAHLRLLAGSARYLTLRMDEDIHVQDGVARVASRVDLDVHGHDVHVQLPDVEMLPDSYQGDHYVEVRVPLFERRW